MPSKDLELTPESEIEKVHRLEEERLREQFQKIGPLKGQTVLYLESDSLHSTRVLSQMVGTKGRVIIVVPSSSTLDVTKKFFGRLRNLSFLQSDISMIALDDDSVDVSLSYGSFNSVTDPGKVMSEMSRVTRRGGRIMVGASDYPALHHYPMPDYLEAQIVELSDRLEEAKIWDPSVGRKLFSMFQELCLEDVKTSVFADRIFVGESNQLETKLWNDRLEKIEHLKDQGRIKLSFDLTAFRSELFTFFQNPVRFSYAPLIFVEGKKPL